MICWWWFHDKLLNGTNGIDFGSVYMYIYINIRSFTIYAVWIKCLLHGRLHQLPVFSFNLNWFLLSRQWSLNIATSVAVHHSSEEVKVEGDFVGESGITNGVSQGDALDLPLMWRVSLELGDMVGDRANGFCVTVDKGLIFLMFIYKIFLLHISYH